MSKGRGRKENRARKPALVILGEDDHDREALRLLIGHLRPDAPRLEKRRSPLVLVKDRDLANQRLNAQDIEKQVRRDRKRFDVRAVVAHQDCDAVEPAHESLADEIEARLSEVDVACVAATPAWELEAWLFLWPDAAPALVPSWSRPARSGKRVGLIRDAKEAYRRALGRKSKREYQESDAPKIVGQACAMGLIDQPDAISASFDRFRSAIMALQFDT